MFIRRKTMEKLLADRERSHAREREEWLRERRDLLDRIMLMADRPWNLPPPPPEPERVGPPEDPFVFPEQLQPDEVG